MHRFKPKGPAAFAFAPYIGRPGPPLRLLSLFRSRQQVEVADESTWRGSTAARGGRWSAVQVKRVLEGPVAQFANGRGVGGMRPGMRADFPGTPRGQSSPETSPETNPIRPPFHRLTNCATGSHEAACRISVAWKCRPLKSCLDRRCSRSTRALRIIGHLQFGGDKVSRHA
jgi:hypothetical protein